MQVTISKVTKYLIVTPELDPISVYMEDLGTYRGKVIIEEYGTAYSCFWGSTGCENIIEFFMKCDNDYLANKLIPYDRQYETDVEYFINKVKNYVLVARRNKEVSKDDVRDWWDTNISSDLIENLEDCKNEYELIRWIDNAHRLYGIDIPYFDFFTTKSTREFLRFRDSVLPVIKQAISDNKAVNDD